jgi:2,4-dienoyl-CoA reductase-like NADH-dependent reductase (Old Yellow Enzyme family)/thioredoxin reductase
MKFPTMFSPINIGTVTVPNRFVVPPMGNNFANSDGSLSERSAAYYEARAKGGFGLITIESTVVYSEAKGGPRKPCLFTDDVVDSFREVAERCHRYGAKVNIQLQHAGPEGNSKLTGYPLKAASAMASHCGGEIPVAMPTEEVYRLIEAYGDAAARAQRAGIDMVEVHCAHGYLVSTFVSARTNKRTDEFGGCFENRMRLPRLIIENIRRKTGNMPILCRINARDEGEGGLTVQDAAAVAAYLEQECGVDALNISRSIHLHDEFMWAPNNTHGGFNADLVTEIKKAVSVPVITVGRYTEPQYAELLVRQGRADLVAFGRQSIADPELPLKARTGHLETLAPCIACLLGCVPNMLAGRPITCAMNPCVGREAEIVPAAVQKKVLVIGGGPGGMYAAMMCAKRGHDVILLEKNTELGGHFLVASYPPAKGEIAPAVRSLIVRCREAGVDIRLGVNVTPELVGELKPDAVIVATGSVPLILPIPGLADCGYINAEDMLTGKYNVGKKVLIVGGGMVGAEAAEHLAERGHDCDIVEMKPVVGEDIMPEPRKYIMASLEHHKVGQFTNARVSEFFTDGIAYTSTVDGSTHELRGYDNIVLAMGYRSNYTLSAELEKLVSQVIVIGEARQAPGNSMLATGDALDAALAI